MRGWSMQHDMADSPLNWADRQRDAQHYLDSRGWPDRRDEAWKFTSLRHLADKDFTVGSPGADITTAPAGTPAPGLDGLVIGINAGIFNADNLPSLPKGVTVRDISNDDRARAELFIQPSGGHLLTALSAVRQTSALVIEIADGVQLDQPLILHFTGGEETVSSYPFIALQIGAGGWAAIAEIHQSSAGLSCPLLAIDIGDQAQLDHIRIQDEARHTTHLGLNHIRIGEQAVVNSFALSCGGCLSRLETHSLFDGTKGDLAQSAIYLGHNSQHHDITSFVAHESANCTSRQLIRGVLDDKARGVFQGKVRVAPDAQKTDGQQMSRALLLSSDAEADAKPELEIFADDVVCSHGATIGELDDSQLFYLCSRGLTVEQAREMLIEAFLLDALGEIARPDFAACLTEAVSRWTAALYNRQVTAAGE